MRNLFRKAMVIAAAALLPVLFNPALAHHSAVTWDLTQRVSITGTVKVVLFRNPHGHLEVLVAKADNSTETWNVETSAMNILVRRGWKFDQVHVGDKLTVIGHPNKTLPLELYARELHLEDGQVFGDPTGKDAALD
jgi:hypothetical protein